MRQKITDFHLDSESHWVADLACGHKQHVRHDPPFFQRPWVLTEEGRKERLNTYLDCKRCDETAMAVAQAVQMACIEIIREAYEVAGQAGLCGEGQVELTMGRLQQLALPAIIEQALRAALEDSTPTV